MKERNIPVTLLLLPGNYKRKPIYTYTVEKYRCNSCDYQATKKGHLTTHKQSKHKDSKDRGKSES
jgi:hypothetical protein